VKACLDVFCPSGNWIEEVAVVVVVAAAAAAVVVVPGFCIINLFMVAINSAT